MMMKTDSPSTLHGLTISLMGIAFGFIVTLATVKYQRPSDPLFCDGRLSAGFPAAFVCDVSGESPLSSVGRIDSADVNGISLEGLFADVATYAFLFWLAYYGGPLLWQRLRKR